MNWNEFGISQSLLKRRNKQPPIVPGGVGLEGTQKDLVTENWYQEASGGLFSVRINPNCNPQVPNVDQGGITHDEEDEAKVQATSSEHHDGQTDDDEEDQAIHDDDEEEDNPHRASDPAVLRGGWISHGL